MKYTSINKNLYHYQLLMNMLFDLRVKILCIILVFLP